MWPSITCSPQKRAKFGKLFFGKKKKKRIFAQEKKWLNVMLLPKKAKLGNLFSTKNLKNSCLTNCDYWVSPAPWKKGEIRQLFFGKKKKKMESLPKKNVTKCGLWKKFHPKIFF